jgi:acetolactate synthase-1/2/3 large subunit
MATRGRYALRHAGSRRFFSDKREVTVAQAIYLTLQKCGIKEAFGFSGGAVLPLIDAFTDGTIPFYTCSNEQGAGHAAAAVGKTTGRPGLCVSTSGPGVTNVVTALSDALQDGAPFLLLTGQVPTTAMGTDAFQECPATAITRHSCKWNSVLMDPNQVVGVIEKAVKTMTSGRPGPVHIDIPKDILNTKVIYEDMKSPLPERPPPLQVNDQDILDAAERINRSAKPLIMVGQGANNCSAKIRELVQKGQFPVTTTLHGMGIMDERDPLSLKMMGMHGSAYANFAIQEASCLINLGWRFDDRTTGVIASYAPVARAASRTGDGGIIHCDIRRESLGRIVQPDVAFQADVADVIDKLLPLIKTPKELPTAMAVERDVWHRRVSGLKKDNPFGYHALSDGRIKTQQAVEMINIVGSKLGLLDNSFITTGVGNHQMMAAQFIDWTQPRQCVTSGSLGTMGVGLPFAIGAQVANPDSTVILIDGDGSFNMTCGELQTAARYNLPVKIAIMNDARQQMVWVWQKLFHGERYISTHNANPDYGMFAGSFGIGYHTVSDVKDLEKATEAWLTAPGPQFMDFKVVPDICLPMVAPGKGLQEMMLLQDHARLWGNEVEFTGMAPS